MKTIGLGMLAFLVLDAWAAEEIIRPYQTVRSAAMGGVRYTTGLYSQNFFGNPAQVVENPVWLVQLPDMMVETTTSTFSNIKNLTSSKNDILSAIGETAGDNIHGRLQNVFPAFYIPEGRHGIALGIVAASQFNINLRNSFQVDPEFITDLGPALTYGVRVGSEKRLALGITVRATYRVTSQENFTFIDIIQGKSLSPLKSGADGAHIDGDIGATYQLKQTWLGFKPRLALAINHLLGGTYKNLGMVKLKNGFEPRAQPRTYNFGLSLQKKRLGPFTHPLFAFEVTDLGNNSFGSLFRLLHFGGELRYGRLRIWAGFNQGYPGGGLGFRLGFLELDLGTYGEERSLNAGGLQDRRFGARLSFQVAGSSSPSRPKTKPHSAAPAPPARVAEPQAVPPSTEPPSAQESYPASDPSLSETL